MKRLFSFSITSTFTFILSVLAILVIAVSAPGMVQAVLGPAPTSCGDVQPGNAIQVSDVKTPAVNPATLSDNGIFGTVGIGTNSPVSPLHIYSTSSTQPETIDLIGPQPITAQWNDYSDTGGSMSGSGFLGRFARGSKASPANVQQGDRLGFNVFGGWSGGLAGAFRHTAAIEAVVDAGSISASSLPTYMKFSTTPNGSVSRVESMRITKDGNVAIGTTNPIHGQLEVAATDQTAVFGLSTSGRGVHGVSTDEAGVYGRSTSGYGVYGESFSNYAGYFQGNVYVTGNINKAACSFQIDHPQDPENKYLIHSTVESPDMMNIYNGNVALDGNGEAVVQLPSYFDALNRDFRYQLTCIGGYAPVYIAQEISGNHFIIAGGKSGLKISWQVTGIRQDAFAKAHPIVVEQEKPASEKGLYLHPIEWGQPKEKGINQTPTK